jgi:ApbE superfamily uncharacterized protein (UPF0280 family)
MNTTTYVHLNSRKDVAVQVTKMSEPMIKATMINFFDEGSQISLFTSPEQIIQIHSALGEYIKANPELFVSKSITELEEVKND